MVLTCSWVGCTAPATCAIGIGIHAVQCVRDYYQDYNPLTTIVLDLAVCETHFVEQAKRGAFDLMPRGYVKSLARATESVTGTAIDIELTSMVRVKFDDPKYVMLKNQHGRH